MAFYFTLGLTVGIVAGIIIKHVQDTKIIKEFENNCCETTKKAIKRLSEEDLKFMNKLLDQNKELAEELHKANKELNRQKDFFDVPTFTEVEL